MSKRNHIQAIYNIIIYRIMKLCKNIFSKDHLYCLRPTNSLCSPFLSPFSCKCHRDSSTICHTTSGSLPSLGVLESPEISCHAKENLREERMLKHGREIEGNHVEIEEDIYLTHRRGNPVSFAIQKSTDLR